jgi:hypothetical protein
MKKTRIVKHQFYGDKLKLYLEIQTMDDKITKDVVYTQMFIDSNDKENIEKYKVKAICDKEWKVVKTDKK